MKLAQVLQGVTAASLDIEISGVTADSREVKGASLFFAVRGGSRDGHEFIQQVAKQGAVAVVGESPAPDGLAIPYFQVPDSRWALARAAANFVGNPSTGMLLIGVTGTSGKTTTTYLIESILQAAGHRVGLIGTVAFRFGSKSYPSTHTTPGPVELQDLLARMKQDGCTAVVMEVSSHALKQHRTASIAFDGMVFTNLSPEHLDFHTDMEDYFRSKALLFTDMVDFSILSGKKPFAAINADDEYGRRLFGELSRAPKPGLRFGKFALAEGIVTDLGGVSGESEGVQIRSSLTGRFNGSNILGALSVTRGLGVPPDRIAAGIEALKLVPGRLERVESARGVHVFVDYAHKPDALEKVLLTLRDIRHGSRLITVFGCGGDRDRTKRPVMGRLSVELSDFVVVTSDNPRTEDPARIIQEILSGIKKANAAHFKVEADRKTAIFEAIRMAKPGDLVLIAGKGHEDYQIIADPQAPAGTRKIHFDDREVAAEALSSY